MVREERFELSRALPQQVLNLPCLPFHHSRTLFRATAPMFEVDPYLIAIAIRGQSKVFFFDELFAPNALVEHLCVRDCHGKT